MKFYVLTAAAILSLAFFNSCKKDVPGYCTANFFGGLELTDLLGNAGTTFTVTEDIVMNMSFTNTSGDTLKVNYSEPWIEYTVLQAGVEQGTSAPTVNNTGLTSMYLANGQGIDGTFTWTQTLLAGNYTLRARCYYQYLNCDNGLLVEEKTVDFVVEQ